VLAVFIGTCKSLLLVDAPMMPPLTTAHHAEVLALGTQLFREEDVPEIGNALATACGPSTVLLAPDNTVAGFALFCQGQCLSTKSSPYHSLYAHLFGDLKNSKDWFELTFFAIHPRHQGEGLGSKLLTHCLAQLPPTACCWLVIEADNMVAPRLYRRHGFEYSHTVPEAHPYPLHMWVRGPIRENLKPIGLDTCVAEAPLSIPFAWSHNAVLSSTMIISDSQPLLNMSM
jgi:ribosomal protein S18 acetylase RimI-like enzyme